MKRKAYNPRFKARTVFPIFWKTCAKCGEQWRLNFGFKVVDRFLDTTSLIYLNPLCDWMDPHHYCIKCVSSESVAVVNMKNAHADHIRLLKLCKPPRSE